MQQAVLAVESEQKRTDHAFPSRITKSADNTVGCADSFYFHRRGAFSRSIRSVQTFCDDAIKIASSFSEPIGRNTVFSRCRRKAYVFRSPQIRTREFFKKLAPLAQ